MRELEALLYQSTQQHKNSESDADDVAENSDDAKVPEELATLKGEVVALKEELAQVDEKHVQARADLVSQHRIALNTARVQLQEEFETRQLQSQAKHTQ